jgi:hypothetical protein
MSKPGDEIFIDNHGQRRFVGIEMSDERVDRLTTAEVCSHLEYNDPEYDDPERWSGHYCDISGKPCEEKDWAFPSYCPLEHAPPKNWQSSEKAADWLGREKDEA